MKIDDSTVDSPATRQAFTARLLKALPLILPRFTISPKRQTHGSSGHSRVVVEMIAPSGRRRTLHVEPKMASAPSQVLHALHRLNAAFPKRSRGYPVLASTFLSPRVRQLCREHGVGYVDLAGNCYLQFDDLYLERAVEKNPSPRRGRPSSLFSPVSTRIVRALLEEPRRRWTLSELAETCRVSLGQTSNVCRRLIAESYGERTDRGVRLVRPGDLLDAWRAAGPMTSAQAAYYSFERDPDRLLRRVAEIAAARRWRYAVTSFAAAARVAPFVRGVGVAQWYIDSPHAIDEWVAALDLRPVESGPNVMLVTPYDEGVFYRAKRVGGVMLVGHVQLYLDLCQERARGVEQAEFLRKERIKF